MVAGGKNNKIRLGRKKEKGGKLLFKPGKRLYGCILGYKLQHFHGGGEWSQCTIYTPVFDLAFLYLSNSSNGIDSWWELGIS